MLDEFETFDHDIDGVRIHGRTTGSGPPLLLLHGYPETHVMWHRIAPRLARTHTVVLADLRGYGDSAKPRGDQHTYSKRAMAADQVGLMAKLGHDRFAVVGHDRGARVTHRMCLDHPHSVERAAVLDIVPTSHVYAHVDRALAEKYMHWFLLSQPDDLPERLIGAQPEYFLRRSLAAWSGNAAFDDAAVEEYVRCFATPEGVRATCNDYRAGAGVDLEHAAADTATVACPLLVLWGDNGFVGTTYDVLDVWRQYASDVRGQGVGCGHFLPEERPDETLAALTDFLTR